MSFLNRKINKKSFAGAAALVFLFSFFAFNTYTSYELKHSKLDQYKSANDFHSKRVNAKISESFEGISELNALEKRSRNYTLANLGIRTNVLESSALLVVEQVSDLNGEQTQNERVLFNLEKISIANDLVFMLNENSSGISLLFNETEYALTSPSKFNNLNFYVGLAFNSRLGLLNYNNPDYSKSFTAAVFKEHTNAAIKWVNQSLIMGVGGQVFGGVMLRNGISIEGGIAYSSISGSAAYRIEHNYIRETERLEWIVTGESNAETVLTKDYVESVAIDTISSTFSRSSFNLPLTLNYTFDLGRIKPFVSAGASVNIVASGNQNIYSSFQRKSAIIEESQGINQLNLQAGIGVDIEISNRFNARIKPSIDFGVWNKNPEYMNGNLRDLSIQTALYYKF
ncbi:MAG: hypothetical protein OSB25_11170 [Salibacteraceae bacterium]|nr:hypothetical protein [Salibacteraceae bacterium]